MVDDFFSDTESEGDPNIPKGTPVDYNPKVDGLFNENQRTPI